MARRFAPLPPVPDHPAIEAEVLARWDAEPLEEALAARRIPAAVVRSEAEWRAELAALYARLE